VSAWINIGYSLSLLHKTRGPNTGFVESCKSLLSFGELELPSRARDELTRAGICTIIIPGIEKTRRRWKRTLHGAPFLRIGLTRGSLIRQITGVGKL
jgi:hypothetical protein